MTATIRTATVRERHLISEPRPSGSDTLVVEDNELEQNLYTNTGHHQP